MRSTQQTFLQPAVVLTWCACMTPIAAGATPGFASAMGDGAHTENAQAGTADKALVPTTRDDQHGPATVFGAPPPGANATTAHYASNVVVPVPDVGFITSTIVVAGAPTKIWDLDVQTFIKHPWSPDLTFSLKSPAGTEVLLSNGNGYDSFAEVGGENVFNGSVWDDSADQFSNLVTEYLYISGIVGTPLVPEGALSRFIGEDPNGVWTLKVEDTWFDPSPNGTGSLQSWSIDVVTLDSELSASTVMSSNAVPQALTNNHTIHSFITISNAGSSICDVDVQTFITHTSNGTLRILLHSPAGTLVTLSRNNGNTKDDVFNGTTWDDSASVPASHSLYVDNVVATPLVPEGALGTLIGEDPNGVWDLQISQSFSAADSGTLNSWSLTVTSCVVGEPGEPYCFGDGADPILTAQCPCANFGDPGRGCANSNGVLGGGRLYASGITTPNTVLLTCDGIPNGALATFMRGPNHNVQGAVFGDGIKCLTSPLFRFGSQNAGTIGNPPNTVGVGALSEIPGSTIHYVVQYRNSVPGFCAPETFNASNGYTISW